MDVPVHSLDAMPPLPSHRAVNAYLRPSLLVVEQNEEASELLEFFLAPEYNLTVLRDHGNVLEWAQRRPYQLVYMGIDEGQERHAMDALSRLRSLQPTSRIPVVASIGYLETEVERLVMQAGFDGFLKRTFTLRGLNTVLRRVLGTNPYYA